MEGVFIIQRSVRVITEAGGDCAGEPLEAAGDYVVGVLVDGAGDATGVLSALAETKVYLVSGD